MLIGQIRSVAKNWGSMSGLDLNLVAMQQRLYRYWGYLQCRAENMVLK